MSIRLPSIETRRRRPHLQATSRRGTATAEAALVMVAALFFLLLAPAIWRIWETEHFVWAEAHRDVFHKLTAPVDLAVADTRWGATNTVKPPRLDDYRWVDPDTLATQSMPNTFVEGWEGKEFNYGSPPGVHGQMRISRAALAIRPPWTLPDWPYVSTQVTSEAALVAGWYADVKKTALAFWGTYGDITSGLKLQPTVLSAIISWVKDQIKDRAKKFARQKVKDLRSRESKPPETHETPPSPKSPPIDDTEGPETNPTPPTPKSPPIDDAP